VSLLKLRRIIVNINDRDIPIELLKKIALDKGVPILFRDWSMVDTNFRSYLLKMTDYNKSLLLDLGFNITEAMISRKLKAKYKKFKI